MHQCSLSFGLSLLSLLALLASRRRWWDVTALGSASFTSLLSWGWWDILLSWSLLLWRSLLNWCLFIEVILLPASLLSEDHNLELVEIRETASDLGSSKLKGSWGLLEASNGILLGGQLLKSIGAASSKNTLDLELGERKSLNWVDKSGHAGVWGINQHSIDVEHVDDDDHLSIVLSKVHKANSTWFNEISKTLETMKTKVRN